MAAIEAASRKEVVSSAMEMHTIVTRVLIGSVFGWILAGLAAPAASGAPEMRYTQAATAWLEAIPIGNGRMGAMVYGTTAEEHLQFNECTLWIGDPHDYSHAGAASHLASIRNQMFTSGSASEITSYFLSEPLRQMPFQPFGDLYFTGHSSVTNYQRKLDLDQGVATVDYDVGAVHYTREFFASQPHNAIVSRMTANTPGGINTTVRITSPQNINGASYTVTAVGNDRLVLAGRLPFSGTYNGLLRTMTNPLFYEAQVRVVVDGGAVAPSGSTLVVTGANAVTVLLVAHTSLVNFQDVSGVPHTRCEADMAALNGVSYDTLKSAYLEDYQGLFRRVSIDLGTTAPSIASQTIAQRLSGFNVNNDPDLVELYFQFGRYLLISCSRSGSEPANLQGVWNWTTDPSWECKYTTNINLEMNYWPAESTNLAECTDPLFDMIDDLRISGHQVAQVHYNARGWVVHHNTDLWRGAAPINNATDGCYPAGAAWLCQHLWWHYEYSGDTTFLTTRAYPAMKEAALFYIDSLVTDPRTGYHNWLVTNPSSSPEHGGLAISPTMDNQIIREFFRDTVAASRILGVDADLRTTLTQMIARIPPNQVGSWGQIMEWLEPNSLETTDPQHRHLSHLWGLFPGEDINRTSPTLFNAARVSLAARGTSASNQTGWALAHRLNLWAREFDGATAYVVLQGLIKSKTYSNLFNNGGGATGFQIDGNFGGTSGLAEMLMQSHAGEISLLPALPSSNWPTGSVRGLRARGGITTNFEWSSGEVTTATLRASLDRTIKLRVPAAQTQIVAVTNPGTKTLVPTTTNADGNVSLDVAAGQNYTVWFHDPPPSETPVTFSSFRIE
jgi:alpha-L-fucosidase 2